MPPTIPIEEMRGTLQRVMAEIATMTLRSTELQIIADQTASRLKTLETRKAKLQDELEKQSNP